MLSFVVAVVVVVVVRRRRHRPFSKSVLLVGKKGVVLVPTEPFGSAKFPRPPKELCDDDNTDDDDDATKTTTTVVETSVSPPPTPPRYKNGFCFSAGVDDADIIQKAFCFGGVVQVQKVPPKSCRLLLKRREEHKK